MAGDPSSIPLRDLVQLAKIRWRIEHDYRGLKDGLGLTLRGPLLDWQAPPRHPRSIAQTICTTLRLTPKAPVQV
ncbi:hypothetical protein IFM12275_24050 [Nocardia sputorum]|nr:hypothetical protein IFM12275_24050 [Nocardia sputorum]